MGESSRTRSRERRNWHVSVWLTPTLIALIVVVVGLIAGLAGWEMKALIVTISLAFAVVLALLWLTSSHLAAKIILSILLAAATAVLLWWVVSYDRPILQPQMGGAITEGKSGGPFSLAIEALVKNTGHQSGYADHWKFVLSIDGTDMEGKELYGQALPPNATTEPQLFDQEFPPGKPVRGWLFFTFPGSSFDAIKPYFTCGSLLIDKVGLKLTVWDTKNKHAWTQSRSERDFAKEVCTSVAAIPDPLPEPDKPITRQQPKRTPAVPPAIPPGSIIQANSGGLNIQQGTTGSNSPIINSPITVGKTPKAISPEEMKELVQFLRSSPQKPLITVGADEFSSDIPFPRDFLKALEDAGWQTRGGPLQGPNGRENMLPYFRGARVFLSVPDGMDRRVKDADPVAFILTALHGLKVPCTLEISSSGQADSMEWIDVDFLNGID
jgi:hypothetical protein